MKRLIYFFCWNFAHVSYLLISAKCSLGVFSFCLRSCVIDKPGFCKCQDLNKIKKSPEHPFIDVGKLEICAKFQQKWLNSMVVEARQSF